MTIKYGDELFSFSVFLVFINRIAAVIFAVVMAAVYKEGFVLKAPLWKYLIVSLSNVYASICQYECLKYIAFAVQMLGKSFKMVPVMLWGILISKKVYTLYDWVIAVVVTLGVAEFLLSGPITSSHESSHNSTFNEFMGLLLLLCFLALDGLTSTMQEFLFNEHKTTKYNQMMYINGFSAIVSFITLLCSRSLIPSYAFIMDHPRFLWDAYLLSASAVSGQFFIYSQVQEFGALVYAATMNVRQIVSILVSYVIYGHYITPFQIIGLVIVFLALFCKSLGFFPDPEPTSENQPLIQKDTNEKV